LFDDGSELLRYLAILRLLTSQSIAADIDPRGRCYRNGNCAKASAISGLNETSLMLSDWMVGNTETVAIQLANSGCVVDVGVYLATIRAGPNIPLP